jgi:SnoaL-like polyketide cyclase
MFQRDQPEDSASSRTRREVLLAAPAVAAVGAGIVYPAIAPAAKAKRTIDCLAKEGVVREHLKTFHYLDFHVFNHQQWDKIGLSHSDDVVVHWPDGRTTVGVDDHIKDLKGFFEWAPDTKVLEHTWLFGGGDTAQYTGCIAIFSGTFSRPMPIGGGKTIPATGKRFKLRFSTTAHWNSDGVLDEEYLIWDNQELGRQIGLS